MAKPARHGLALVWGGLFCLVAVLVGGGLAQGVHVPIGAAQPRVGVGVASTGVAEEWSWCAPVPRTCRPHGEGAPAFFGFACTSP